MKTPIYYCFKFRLLCYIFIQIALHLKEINIV